MKIKALALLLLLPLLALGQVRVGIPGQSIRVGSGINVDAPLIQAETSAWQAAVIANGGSYSATDVRAVDYFVSQCKAKGIWSLIDWVTLFAGRNLNAALVPVKRTVGSVSITNNNFVEGDFSPTAGLTGNGTTKYLNPGINNNSFGSQNSKTLGVFVTSVPTGTMHQFSASSTAGSTGLFRTGGNYGVRVNNATSATAGVVVMGNLLATRTTSTDISYVRGANTGSVASTSESPSNESLFLFANNTPSAYSNSAIGAALCGQGLTSQQLSDLAAILTQTMAILGRPTS